MKYEVVFKRTTYTTVLVDADDSSDAKKKAKGKLSANFANATKSTDMVVDSCGKVDEAEPMQG